MPADTIVFEVGTEGGSLSILLRSDPNGADSYVVRRDESALVDMLNDEDREGIPAVTSTGDIAEFNDALAVSDPSKWVHLVPVVVQPRYLEPVLREVERQGGQLERIRWLDLLALHAQSNRRSMAHGMCQPTDST